MQLPKQSSRGRGRAHRLFHPLCGATLPTLARLLLQGGVAPGRAHVAAIAVAMAGLRLPFTLGEAAFSALHGHDDDLPAPIFIVGHWRSGTTHLANLLSRSPAFGILSPMSVGLPAEALGLARVARPFVEQFFPRKPADRCGDARLRPAAGGRAGDGQSLHPVVQPWHLFPGPAAGGVRPRRIPGRRAGPRTFALGGEPAWLCRQDDPRRRPAVADPQSGEQRPHPAAARNMARGALHPYPPPPGRGGGLGGSHVRGAGARTFGSDERRSMSRHWSGTSIRA